MKKFIEIFLLIPRFSRIPDKDKLTSIVKITERKAPSKFSRFSFENAPLQNCSIRHRLTLSSTFPFSYPEIDGNFILKTGARSLISRREKKKKKEKKKERERKAKRGKKKKIGRTKRIAETACIAPLLHNTRIHMRSPLRIQSLATHRGANLSEEGKKVEEEEEGGEPLASFIAGP